MYMCKVRLSYTDGWYEICKNDHELRILKIQKPKTACRAGDVWPKERDACQPMRVERV